MLTYLFMLWLKFFTCFADLIMPHPGILKYESQTILGSNYTFDLTLALKL